MKTVFLHGLGQTAQDWKEVVQQLSISDVDCPELFSLTEDGIIYNYTITISIDDSNVNFKAEDDLPK